jgi:hypothetical protein
MWSRKLNRKKWGKEEGLGPKKKERKKEEKNKERKNDTRNVHLWTFYPNKS